MASKLEACAECKRKCLLCHSKTRSSMPLVSSFFKIMISDKCTEILLLPPKFAPIVSSLIGKEVPVEDSNGNQWKAKLTVVDSSIVLKQGWGTFAQDHGLEVGDFLSFHYILGSHFIVQIFDRTCCEKLDFPIKTRAESNKGSSVKKEPKSSAFSKRKFETTHCQFETSNMKNVKMAKNGDKKRVARSRAVTKVEIFEEPSFLTYRKGKCKIDDSVNDKMLIDCSLRNIDSPPRPQTVVVPKSSLKPGKNQGSNFDWSSEKANSRKKPKALPKQDDRILVSPVVNKDKFGKKAKLEALETEPLALTVAGAISCLIGSNQSFLKLPAALPSSSSSNKRRTMENNSKRVVLLKGPKPELMRVEYYETPRVKILMGGWEAFCKHNKIMPGEECTFEVENEAEDTFRVTVVANV